jgi:hypothetical protein
MPAGSVSENPTPVRVLAEFGLWMVKLSEVVPPCTMLLAPNALLIVGGAITAVSAVALLLPMLGSAVDALAVAVFEIDPAAVAFTTRVMVAEPLLASVPRAQVTVVVPLQVPTDGVAETNVVPEGRVSLTLARVAALGPAFETVMV